MIQNFFFSKSILLAAALFVVVNILNAQAPIAHYKFDGNLNDETGNWNLSESSGFTVNYETGHDGAIMGAVGGFTLGSSNYLSTSTDFTPLSDVNGNASRTVMAWIKLTSNGNQAIVGLGSGLGAGGVEYNKYTFGGINNAATTGPLNRIEVKGAGQDGSELPLDTWIHTATTWDSVNQTLTLYLNGILDASLVTNLPLGTDPNPLRVGNDYTNEVPDRGFSGAIDDVRVFNELLSEAQIKAIYDATTLGTEELKLEAFNAYPNPVQNRFYFSSKKVASVDIYNLLGSKVSSQVVNKGIDMSTLAEGTYIIKALDARGVNIKTVKVVKQ
jgi:hypothetical protein